MRYRSVPVLAVLACVATLLPSAPLSAQESTTGLAGAWTLVFSSSQGRVEMPLDLTPDGSTLEGVSGAALGFPTAFGEGETDGTSFSFEVFVEVQGEWYPLYFDGAVEGDELVGRVSIPDGSRPSFRGVRREGVRSEMD